MNFHLGSHYKCTQDYGIIEAGACVELLWANEHEVQVRLPARKAALSMPVKDFCIAFRECRCEQCGA